MTNKEMQMKRTSGSRILDPSRRAEKYSFQQGVNSSKANPFMRSIKSAGRKIAAVFTIFIPRSRKADGAIDDASKSSGHVSKFSFSTELSTRSNSKTSSRFRSSSSYGSSSTPSGFIGTTMFTVQEIYKATENFSRANQIGEGSFGTIYKGRLKDGSLVAVKRAHKNTYDKQLLAEFKNEVLTLSKIEHLNLVRLYGFVEHRDEQIIVVEFIGNGNLREHLDANRTGQINLFGLVTHDAGVQVSRLEIAERLDIAIDVAHAITYLHTYTEPPIIHRDIKSSNILLTEKLRAKVADFGFARLTTGDTDATHISTQIKGTSGYLDPEYLRTYQLTEKSDVYSFGVVLVELMSGRHPIEQKRPPKERLTAKWAMLRLKEGDAILVMDPFLRRSPASNVAVEKVLTLANRCLAPLKQSRPSMKECAEVLWVIRKDFREKALSSSSSSHQSANFPQRDPKKIRNTAYGMGGEDSPKFMSA